MQSLVIARKVGTFQPRLYDDRKSLNLTVQQKADLVQYLKSL